jgi:hypothetical protein
MKMETAPVFKEVKTVKALKATEADLTGLEPSATHAIGLELPAKYASQIDLLYNEDKTYIIPATGAKREGKSFVLNGYISPHDARLWYRNHLGFTEEGQTEPDKKSK